MLEFAGVERLFPYLVISNILGSLALDLVTLYHQSFGGELSLKTIMESALYTHLRHMLEC
jgi:hypothetical protein